MHDTGDTIRQGGQTTRHDELAAVASPSVRPPIDRLPARSSFGAGLSSSASRRLLASARVREYEAGQALCIGDTYPGGCWLLLEGHVKEHWRLRDGSDVITDIRGPGDLVAEATALDRAPSPVDISAVDPVTALFLGATELARLAATDHEIAAALHHAVSERALWAQRLVVRNGHRELESRAIAALLDLADRFGHDVATGRCLGVPLSQAELAAWSGMSRESFAKVLRRLRSRGLVITSRCDIVLPDVDALSGRLITPRCRPLATSRRRPALGPAR